MKITKEFLQNNQNHIFVFGDNTIRKGLGGAAKLRNEPNTYGFITKKYPNNYENSFYEPVEYSELFLLELVKLINYIRDNEDSIFLISKLGGGLANRNRIWENVIKDGLKILKNYNNVVFLYED